MWKIAEEIGYTPMTTFWDDFSIAEKFGQSAIADTAKRAFNEWKHDYVYLTELILVLNHKSWEYAIINSELSSFYSDLYEIYDNKAYNEIKDNPEASRYYYRTLD